MKHPSSRAYFAYWDEVRGNSDAPERSDVEPAAVRQLLPDTFVLCCEAPSHAFRFAGTRVCALFGCDVKGKSFSSLFAPPHRREIEDIIAAVTEETLPAVAGISAISSTGPTAHLELLLLPFSPRAHTPISLSGLIAPFETECGVLSELTLTSWRYLHHRQKMLPRLIRKLAIARGLMVYEGLR